MNHQSNEVKQLVARAGALLAREGALDVRAAPAAEVLKALLPALVNGTKEKNTYVRANSELALRAILRLPHEDDFCQVRTAKKTARIGALLHRVRLSVLLSAAMPGPAGGGRARGAQRRGGPSAAARAPRLAHGGPGLYAHLLNCRRRPPLRAAYYYRIRLLFILLNLMLFILFTISFVHRLRYSIIFLCR